MMVDLVWLVQRLTWMDVLDITLVALTFFWIFYTLQGTRAMPLARGIAALLLVMAVINRLIYLRAFSWLLQQILPALLVAIPVVFQPELRRALEQIGRGQIFRLMASPQELDQLIQAVTNAALQMAQRHIGALIVFERNSGLREYIETGVAMESQVTPELLMTIFNPGTILHDGAVIIRQGRIAAAACVMPLTTAYLSDRQLGLRHRAALGITEESDAVALVVSEERGSVSIAHNGHLIRDLEAARIAPLLHTLLNPPEARSLGTLMRRFVLPAKSERSV